MPHHVNDTHPGSRTTRPAVLLSAFVLLVFCTGTAEYLVSGILPVMANSLRVSVALAGQSVTAYALGVALGGPVVTMMTARFPRRPLALGLCALFIIGLVLTFVARSFTLMIVGRALSACSQATLFAIALTTVTEVMGPRRSGQAVAIVGSGLTLATVMGVPLGAILGGTHNWRLPFAVVAVLATIGTALLAWTMPADRVPETALRDEVLSLLHPRVVLSLATTVAGFAGVGILFTYLVPLLTTITGLAPRWIPALLLLYGVGGFIGNLAAGRLTDMSLRGTLTGVLIMLAVTLVAFPLAAPHPAAAVALVIMLGLLSTATVVPLQALVLQHAGQAPTLALAVNVGAFNLANAIGAATGGWYVAHGHLSRTGWIATPFAVAGLVLAIGATSHPESTLERHS